MYTKGHEVVHGIVGGGHGGEDGTDTGGFLGGGDRCKAEVCCGCIGRILWLLWSLRKVVRAGETAVGLFDGADAVNEAGRGTKGEERRHIEGFCRVGDLSMTKVEQDFENVDDLKSITQKFLLD